MKLKGTLLAVANKERSLRFYRELLGLCVESDFGANVTLSGGISLQTLDTWQDFLEGKPVLHRSHEGELYFEEEAFDAFLQKLEKFAPEYLHPVKEHRWGQRVVRFYDPDGHLLEVGESMTAVCRRFSQAGMTPEQIAKE